jgi:hypothetical protein
VENIADAVTHARFVGTDQSSDGVVLMKILQVYERNFKNSFNVAGFEVFTVLLLKVTVIWYVIPFWLIICY